LIRDPQGLRSLAAEADALTLTMRPRRPFATNNWLELWWQNYREQRALVRDEFYLHVLRDGQGKLIALAPLALTERPSVGPLRTRGFAFLGSDKNITELRGLICAPEHEAAAARALVEHLYERRNTWDWFAWHGVTSGGEAHRYLSGLPKFEWRREVIGYQLELPDNWEEFRTTRSRNIKESLRKCYNSLKRDGHSFTFQTAEDAGELKLALERFFDLHARRSQATDLPDHANYFQAAPAKNLLRGLAAKPEQLPGLRVFELKIGAQVVASRVAFVLGDELYLYFSGYEPDWSRYSVMTTTVAESIKWAIARKMRIVNLSTGTDVSKTRWSPTSYTSCYGILPSPSFRGPLVWGLMNRVANSERIHAALAPLMALARRRV
jgi:CelD/BcsL family acetyltransferase involved in cellulose biosynthesis